MFKKILNFPKVHNSLLKKNTNARSKGALTSRRVPCPINSPCFSGNLTMTQFYWDACVAALPIEFLPSWTLRAHVQCLAMFFNLIGQLSAPSAVLQMPVHCLCPWPLTFVVDIPPFHTPFRRCGSSVRLLSTLGWVTPSKFSVNSLVPSSTYLFLLPLLPPQPLAFVPLIVFPCSDFPP